MLVPIELCSLFVPNTIDIGIPVKVRAGKLINPPPPATASTNPAKKPMRIKNEYKIN
jgi:hypothetical protein